MTMRIPIKKTFKLECSNCDEEFFEQVNIQDLEHVSSDDREMGTENQYDFTATVQCPVCEHEWEVRGEIWEYPEGAINLVELLK